MKINKKILASVFVIGILALGIGWGTHSLFSDTETSSGNTFTAGTLDLGLANSPGTNPTGSVTATWTMSNMKPSDTCTATLYVHNDGSINATKVYIRFSYTTTEGTPATVDPGTSTLDNELRVTDARWNDHTMRPADQSWGPKIADTKTLSTLPTTWVPIGTDTSVPLHYVWLDPGAEAQISITWRLDSDADNGVQGDSATITVEIMAEQ
jgi:predicted ribosomally synthesized peptide with SipW-like signal peptide